MAKCDVCKKNMNEFQECTPYENLLSIILMNFIAIKSKHPPNNKPRNVLHGLTTA